LRQELETHFGRSTFRKWNWKRHTLDMHKKIIKMDIYKSKFNILKTLFLKKLRN